MAKLYIATNPEFVAKNFPNAVVYTVSDIKTELYGNSLAKGDCSQIRRAMDLKILKHLFAGEDVIYDATGLSREDKKLLEKKFLNAAEVISVYKNGDIDKDNPFIQENLWSEGMLA